MSCFSHIFSNIGKSYNKNQKNPISVLYLGYFFEIIHYLCKNVFTMNGFLTNEESQKKCRRLFKACQEYADLHKTVKTQLM